MRLRTALMPLHLECLLLLLFTLFLQGASASNNNASSQPLQAEEKLYIDTSFTLPSILNTRQTVAANSSGQDGYTCSPDTPCSNGACCGRSGWCGYGPTYCGDGCQSNCNATADCGEYAATAGQTCPLNVCCSQYGFCGTTSEFCDTGCQSNCQQPEPSAAASNVQTRIVGYWEAWNSQHACGTMAPGEIPVNLLTHLNVAFGYISSSFEVISMDGVSPDIYSSVGNVKSRNPSIKLIIALGGWSFSDPGPYQAVFPTMVSTAANRAVFINNLLGFLSQYGYDGVDFDWEYPGADDRGGSSEDGVNYTALLKELRAAINASGKDYIVTFTAPTSYWYLQHFDIENMYPYADWINLMAYDLHGVWDSSDPIGNQVLAHTNLTEIDLALDLFWRAGVDPSAIVLGLGFYGRSFTLEDASCWQPGCAFSGAGAAGPCTGTAGILSYREIMQILTNTGATSYLDTTDAVRYLVYDGNSWISYDDATTFQMKIDFANSKGLSGLMVWAIDLDDANQDALHAISNASELGAVDNPFNLVDLADLFPSAYLPDNDTTPLYGLVNIGSAANAGNMDPSVGGFGFFLIAGESYAVTKLRKRVGEPEPFTFLDCPYANPAQQAPNETQVARVTCFSDDLEGCFRVMERGVEGTIVEMPDNCAPNTFARAISLELSKDQELPKHLAGRKPSSAIFDFAFDFNMEKLRRDSSQVSIRMDYSNIGGYWDTLVNSPGVETKKKRDDKNNLQSRYYAPEAEEWETLLDSFPASNFDLNNSAKIDDDISAPLFWQQTEDCSIAGEDYGESFGAYVEGTVDATLYYGFSMVAIVQGGTFIPLEASGVLSARGSTDLTYTIGGVGDIDVTQMNMGNPSFSVGNPVDLGGSSIMAGNSFSYVDFTPYYTVVYQMASMNGTDTSPSPSSAFSGAAFDGVLSTRIVTDLGTFGAFFPATDYGTVASKNGQRKTNQIEIPSSNVVYDTKSPGGQIAIGTYVYFGLAIELTTTNLLAKSFFRETIANMTLTTNTMAVFSFYPDTSDLNGRSCADYDIATNIFQSASDANQVGWDADENSYVVLAYDRQGPGGGATCYSNAASSTSKKKRDLEIGEARKVTDQLSPEPKQPHSSVTAEDRSYSSSSSTTTTAATVAEREELALFNNEVNDNNETSVLLPRADGGIPGWYVAAGIALSAAKIFGAADITSLFQQNTKFPACRNCLKCDFDDNTDDDDNSCLCGCESMDYVWGYTDIPLCDDCDCVNQPEDPAGSNCDDGTWPGVSLTGTVKKRNVFETSSQHFQSPASLSLLSGDVSALSHKATPRTFKEDEEHHLVDTTPLPISLDSRSEDGSSESFNTSLAHLDIDETELEYGAESGLHWLDSRVSGTATISYKRVTVCSTKISSSGAPYPAFPANVNFPWTGIDSGVWDPISAYWGNSSALCTSWGVSNNGGQADKLYVSRGQSVRAKYQTEHVFEGQLIGDFFSTWLNTGKVKNQNPDPGTTTSIIDCSWTQAYIMSIPAGATNLFSINNVAQPLIQVLLAELGSVNHRDRLTIFKARPNRKKGSMFSGNQPTSMTTFNRMSAADQLQSAKEMGMIFNYLNEPTVVWPAFCGTYEAIYDLLGEFDTWYSTHGTIAVPSLQDEWKTYIRTALDSMVMRSRTTFDTMASAGLLSSNIINVWASAQWAYNIAANKGSIKLTQVCQNMDPTNV